MATHSNTVAWRLPWTEESGGLLCKESDMTEHIEEEEGEEGGGGGGEEEETRICLFVCFLVRYTC